LDTFYYFPQPQSDLSVLRRVLKSDGLLVVELPLATSRIFRTSNWAGRLLSRTRRPLLESSDHLFYYTPKSISLLLRRCGFRIDAIVPLPGNKQESLLQDVLYKIYYLFSRALHFLSGSHIFLAPRFMVVAGKDVP
jgi:hypothetical protein